MLRYIIVNTLGGVCMSSFVKGVLTGVIGSVVVFSLVKFLFSFICIAVILAVLSSMSGINLVSLANILLIWVFWKLFGRRKKNEKI